MNPATSKDDVAGQNAEFLLPISQRLKVETRALHDVAESHPFQRALAAGRISTDAYTDLLVQWYHIHHTIEPRWIADRRTEAKVRELASPERMKTARLVNDLVHFGHYPEKSNPLPATVRLTERLHDCIVTGDHELVGCWYVLEGSTNGNKFVARALARALGLTSDQGLSYLDAYGPKQSERWAEFKAAMDRLPLTGAATACVIAGAKRMFSGVIDIANDLWSRHETVLSGMRESRHEFSRVHQGDHGS